MEQWRLIPLLNTSGAMQMAIDGWLLDQHRAGQMPSVLRFYTWSPVAISLGYHQRHYPDHWQSLTWQGHPLDIVRRPSGGRAVLHQGELTYAVITSGLQGDRTQVYRTLCQFLIAGMERLEIALDYGIAGRGYIHNPNCFGTATAADLVLPDGIKLIGSAQLKRGNAILQHGSIRLGPDPNLFEQVFEIPLARSPLWDISPPIPTVAAVIQALTSAAQEQFGIKLVEQPLTPSEWHDAVTQSQKWHKPTQAH
ncbi:MAG: lipoate--protein ligase family protein [Cyanothece sp. SIO2G6]|nr:lipoate--protein ligase family protein [Cyanothece sp. SIO2G6]